MYKMCKLDNRGSTTIEMSIIMPIVLAIIVLLIQTFIDAKEIGENQCDTYTKLYVESEEKIYGEVSDRLWRWQLYGDVLCE